MKRDLLPYLSCPQCSANLKLENVTESSFLELCVEEIMSGSIQCSGGHSYPMVGGIPRMVNSELSGAVDVHTGKKFCESWKQFSRFHEAYIQQFFDWLAPIKRTFVKDKLVLDAGCGKGRHARILYECGARTVIAVDIGDSVEVAYANLREFPNVHVVQGDIKYLPVKPIFDFVYSTGVLHHMQEPRRGFDSLVKKLNHEGTLAVWVYGRENNWWITAFIDPLRKSITSRLSEKPLRAISKSLATILFFIAQYIYLPWHELRAIASYLPALFYESYISYIASFDFEEIDHIIYDHLVAPVAYYLPREEVKAWGASSEFKYSRIRWHNQNSWTLVVSKDVSAATAVESTQFVPRVEATFSLAER